MTAPLLLAVIAAMILAQAAIGVGVAFWHLRHRGTTPFPISNVTTSKPETGAWAGWREFRIESDTFEDSSRSQRSLILVPVDGQPLPDFVPGQYLTISIDRAASPTEPKRPIVRCYSLSDQPNGKTYRITVKRVSTPSARPDRSEGAASAFLHDTLKVGDSLKSKAPAGPFMLDIDSDVPAVFIAGGVGVTPLLSMIAWSLAHRPTRHLFLFYGVRNSGDHAFKAVLSGFARSHPTFTLTVFYAAPGPDDVAGRDFQQAGFIDLAVLQRVLPHGPHQFYVCGPPAMMAAIVPALAKWGVARSDLHFEFFGPASAGPIRQTGDGAETLIPHPLEIQFRRSRRTVAWTGVDANLLDFAERHGFRVEAGCRTGSCGTCETGLVSGEVRYTTTPDFDIAPGTCLLCVGVPVANLVLEA